MTNKKKTKLIVIIITLLAFVAVCIGITLHIVSGNNSKADKSVDLDLSTMSATAIYSEVSNMMTDPKKYVGKTIKVKGYYTVSIDPGTGERYTYCLIPDATECCQQGLLFKLKKGEASKLPAEDKKFVISGKFTLKTLPEDKNATYVELENAKVYKDVK